MAVLPAGNMSDKSERIDERVEMVSTQIQRRGITNPRVLKAMSEVPRHLFVPAQFSKEVYSDWPLPIGEGQTISQPYIVAFMTELMKLTGKEKVLEVGTGSGYQAAVLSCLAEKVYTIERHEPLAKRANEVLAEIGCSNIHVRVGDGTEGWPEEAPFDAIMVTAAAEEIPQSLKDQLKDGGRIVAPLGGAFSQMLTVLERKHKKWIEKPICGCVFVPLISGC